MGKIIEIFPPLIIYFSYMWLFRMQRLLLPLTIVLCFGFIVLSFYLHRERLYDLGVRFDNFFSELWKVSIIIILSVGLIIALNNHYQFPIWPVNLKFIMYWISWGIIQQFITQGFFYIRLDRALNNRFLSILGTAIIFSWLHALNIPLMIITFFGGIIWSYLFSRNRNIFTLGLCHGIVSIFLQSYLVPGLVANLKFGPVETICVYYYGSGVKVACGDVNGDGKIEIITGRGPSSENDSLIKVFDSKGNEISSFFAFDKKTKFGINIAVGDIDGDGKKEIIVSPGISPGNKAIVKVFDWEGKEILSFRAFSRWKDYGAEVASGDFDGNGKDEIVVGTAPGLTCFPELKIWTGNGKKIKTLYPYNRDMRADGTMRHGINVTCGNFTGDKKAEMAIGLVYLNRSDTNLKIIDFEGNEISRLPLPKERNGWDAGVILNSGDINGDGYDEIVRGYGVHECNNSFLTVLDGNLNFIFDTIVYPDLRYAYGLNVAAGDIDGDGKDELIAGLGPGPDYPSEVTVLKPAVPSSFKILLRFNAY